MEVSEFLKMLYREDKKWREELAKKAFYEPYQFNPLRFLRRDEMGLSSILAFFLDPKETHAQQDLFLNAFLKKLKLHHFLAYDKVIVETEKMLKAKNGRHDIFIQGILKGKVQWVISIENKLNWANDQPNQVISYIDDMEKMVQPENYFMLYLPVYFQEPKSISKEKWEEKVQQNKAAVWDVRKVIEWLDSCLVGSSEVKQFVSYFIKYLNEEVLGMSENANKLVDLIVNDDKNIKMALDIISLKNDICHNLIEKFRNDLKNNFNAKYLNKKVDLNKVSLNKAWEEIISFNKTNNSNYYFFLAFNEANYQGLYYAIYIKNGVDINNLKIDLNKLKIDRKENFVLYWDWSSNKSWDSETWAKIPSGQLADEIWQEIEPMLKEVVEFEL